MKVRVEGKNIKLIDIVRISLEIDKDKTNRNVVYQVKKGKIQKFYENI